MLSTIKKSLHITAVAALTLASTGQTASATELNLPNAPLEFSAGVQPNIFMMLDDSGSMDWGLLTKKTNGVIRLADPAFTETDRQNVLDGTSPTSDASYFCEYYYTQPTPGIDETSVAPPGINNDNHFYVVSFDPFTFQITFQEMMLGDGAVVPSEEAVLADFGSTLGAWLARNKNYNPLYYNPEVVYTPWKGKNINDADYSNVSPTQAPYNPYRPGDGTIDLTDGTTSFTAGKFCGITFFGQAAADAAIDDYTINVSNYYPARYYTWTDTNTDTDLNGNGVVDSTDTHTLIEIRPEGVDTCTSTADITASCPTTFTRSLKRTDCVGQDGDAEGTVTCTRTEELQNFANWFTYYRKRDLATKKAVSEALVPSTSRVGLSSIHNNDSIGTQVKDVDNISQRGQAEMNAGQTNKDTLLGNLFRMRPGGRTPLRQSLQNVGKYYEGTSGVSPLFNATPNPLSPILPADEGGTCQQNFTLLFTDGFRNGDAPAPSVGDADTDGAPGAVTISDGSTVVGPFDGGTYADPEGANLSNTLADVAMYYYERDLSNLDDEVPITEGGDQNPQQHMTTFTIGFGVDGNIPADANPGDADFTNWPTTISINSIETVDDLHHAGYNGRGGYFSAGDPADLIDKLNDAFDKISENTGQAAAIGASTTSLNVDTQLFQAIFDSRRWSGEIIAFDFPLASNLTEVWRAGEQLDDITAANRVIFTVAPDTGAVTPFQWDSLSAAQKADLKTNDVGGTDSDDIGTARLNFIRGDRGCEIGETTNNCVIGSNSNATRIFRRRGLPGAGGTVDGRNGKLGDIIHSKPDFVGRPLPFFYPDTYPFPEYVAPPATDPSYTGYELAMANRKGVIYVGANDGMLHAFVTRDSTIGSKNFEAGDELFGFIPSQLYSTSTSAGLHELSESTYTHRFYVDLSPFSSPAYIDPDGNGDKDWTDVLVGGLRSGGQGYFALDVTDPAGFVNETTAVNKFMWQFTDSNDADMGLSYSVPVIALVQTASDNNGNSPGSYTWVAIFGNGYNNTAADGHASSTGNAVLYIVNLETGALLKKIDTEAGPADPATEKPNGIGGISVVDLNFDGVSDVVYGGDLYGNLWKFDLRGGNVNNWDVPYSTGGGGGGGGGGGAAVKIPVFKAVTNTTDNVAQPITTRPFVSGGPVGEGGVLIYFGTGKLIENGDELTAVTQSFYGVWDKDPVDSNGDPDPSSFVPFTKDDLLQQTFTTDTFTDDNGVTKTVLIDSDNGITYRVDTDDATIDYLGWYIDLTAFGTSERVFFDPIVLGNIVFFNTIIPNQAVCSAGGDGVTYTVDRFDGGTPNVILLDFNGDGQFDADDQVTLGDGTKATISGVKHDGIPTEPTFVGDQVFTGGIGEGAVGTGVNTNGNDDPNDDCIAGTDCTKRNITKETGRLSWRELVPK